MRMETNTELPTQAVEEAIGELRDVMVQYTICADPSKSAARKERMRQPEEAGQIEETAIRMVRANMINQTQTSITDELEQQPERIHVSLRLGPTNETTITCRKNTPKVVTRNKPGRPPSNNKAQGSPSVLPAASSRKRKIVQMGLSPKKKLNLEGKCPSKPSERL